MLTQSAPLMKTVKNLKEDSDFLLGLCDRIEQVNPDLHAVLPESDRRGRLHDEIDMIQNQFPDEKPPLYGIPIGIKDIIHVDKFETRAGTALPPELIQGPEAKVVKDMRDAGALVLGKTVTTEFAGSPPGLTRNPHDLNHTPGGSSSGSAAAVAAGMCPLAIGTQTGGSVIRPAAFCGIVGFKPSFNRIPMTGIIRRSETLDHVGLFTQDVAGMQLSASLVCEDWENINSLPQPTLGVPEGPYLEQVSTKSGQQFQNQLQKLRDSGYKIVHSKILDGFYENEEKHANVANGEFALIHADWFNEYEPFYRKPTADRIQTGESVTVKELAEGRSATRERREVLEKAMENEGIDIWISPASLGPAPKGITSIGDGAMNRLWTDAGLPTLTLPAGEVDGLPVGLQCAAHFMNDECLLEWAQKLIKYI